jgi:hypothetical protein
VTAENQFFQTFGEGEGGRKLLRETGILRGFVFGLICPQDREYDDIDEENTPRKVFSWHCLWIF